MHLGHSDRTLTAFRGVKILNYLALERPFGIREANNSRTDLSLRKVYAPDDSDAKVK